MTAALVHDLRTKSTNGNSIAGMVMNEAADCIEGLNRAAGDKDISIGILRDEIARLTEQCDRAIDLTGKAQDRMIDMSDRAEKAEAERGVALARVAVMEEALHFYADFCETPNDGPWGVGSTDFGSVARAALKGGAEQPAKPPAKRDRGKMVRPAPGAPCGGYRGKKGGAA
jgi:hypothetical protein